MIGIFLYVIAGLMALATVADIRAIGKPREPITLAAGAVIWPANVASIVVLVVAAWRLS
jgi:hypothetical protein